MRESDAGKGLVRRTTTPYVWNDGRISYYASNGSTRVVTSPGPLGEWYSRANAWGEKLLKFVEAMEGGPSSPRERPDIIEAPVETTRNVVLTVRLVAKVGHVLVLAVWAGGYIAWERIKLLDGSH
jgi:hypothetical protein